MIFIILTLTIAWHELGHYVACRSLGVPVSEFAVGIGPKILRRRVWGTEWSLRAFMIGGYIKPKNLDLVHPAKKFIIALAGPFANFVIVFGIAAYIHAIRPIMGLLGNLYVSQFALTWDVLKRPFVALGRWWHPVIDHSATRISQAQDSIVGPIGMMSHHPTDESWLVSLITSLLVINLGLMLFNLLPVPVLDGGRALFALIEGCCGRKRTERFELVGNIMGGLLLLTLMLIVTVSDIAGLF